MQWIEQIYAAYSDQQIEMTLQNIRKRFGAKVLREVEDDLRMIASFTQETAADWLGLKSDVFREISLGSLSEKMRRLVAPGGESRFEFKLNPKHERTKVRVKVQTLLEIILNLTKNAGEAIDQMQKDSGFDSDYQPKVTVSIELAADREHFVIAVIDNGTGMSVEQVSKANEGIPFSTGKFDGTGEGLASSYAQILGIFHGQWQVISEAAGSQSAGYTQIKMILPVHGERQLRKKPAPSQDLRSEVRNIESSRVLEPSVRDLTESSLTGRSEVRSVANETEAVQVIFNRAARKHRNDMGIVRQEVRLASDDAQISNVDVLKRLVARDFNDRPLEGLSDAVIQGLIDYSVAELKIESFVSVLAKDPALKRELGVSLPLSLQRDLNLDGPVPMEDVISMFGFSSLDDFVRSPIAMRDIERYVRNSIKIPHDSLNLTLKERLKNVAKLNNFYSQLEEKMSDPAEMMRMQAAMNAILAEKKLTALRFGDRLELDAVRYLKSRSAKDVFEVRFVVRRSEGHLDTFTVLLALKTARALIPGQSESAITHDELEALEKINQKTGNDGSRVPVLITSMEEGGQITGYFEEMIEGPEVAKLFFAYKHLAHAEPQRATALIENLALKVAENYMALYQLLDGAAPTDMNLENVMVRRPAKVTVDEPVQDVVTVDMDWIRPMTLDQLLAHIIQVYYSGSRGDRGLPLEPLLKLAIEKFGRAKAVAAFQTFVNRVEASVRRRKTERQRQKHEERTRNDYAMEDQEPSANAIDFRKKIYGDADYVYRYFGSRHAKRFDREIDAFLAAEKNDVFRSEVRLTKSNTSGAITRDARRLSGAKTDIFQRDFAQSGSVAEAFFGVKNLDSGNFPLSIEIYSDAFGDLFGGDRAFFKRDVQRVGFGIVTNFHRISSLLKIIDVNGDNNNSRFFFDKYGPYLLSGIHFSVPQRIKNEVSSALQFPQFSLFPGLASDGLHDLDLSSTAASELYLRMIAELDGFVHAGNLTDPFGAVNRILQAPKRLDRRSEVRTAEPLAPGEMERLLMEKSKESGAIATFRDMVAAFSKNSGYSVGEILAAFRNLKILDVGTGFEPILPNFLIHDLGYDPSKVYAIDSILKYDRRNPQFKTGRFVTAKVENAPLAWNDLQFDMILSFAVFVTDFPDVFDPYRASAAVHRLLKPQGFFIASNITREVEPYLAEQFGDPIFGDPENHLWAYSKLKSQESPSVSPQPQRSEARRVSRSETRTDADASVPQNSPKLDVLEKRLPGTRQPARAEMRMVKSSIPNRDDEPWLRDVRTLGYDDFDVLALIQAARQTVANIGGAAYAFGQRGDSDQVALLKEDFRRVLQGKLDQGEPKTLDIIQFGLGLRPLETNVLLFMLYEVLKGFPEKGWSIQFYGFDPKETFIETARQEAGNWAHHVMFDELGSKVSWQFSEGDVFNLSEAGRDQAIMKFPQADYIFYRNVSYANVETQEGFLTKPIPGFFETGNPAENEPLVRTLASYLPYRNLILTFGKSGTRLVVEQVGENPSKPVFVPPGTQAVGPARLGILELTQPEAVEQAGLFDFQRALQPAAAEKPETDANLPLHDLTAGEVDILLAYFSSQNSVDVIASPYAYNQIRWGWVWSSIYAHGRSFLEKLAAQKVDRVELFRRLKTARHSLTDAEAGLIHNAFIHDIRDNRTWLGRYEGIFDSAMHDYLKGTLQNQKALRVLLPGDSFGYQAVSFLDDILDIVDTLGLTGQVKIELVSEDLPEQTAAVLDGRVTFTENEVSRFRHSELFESMPLVSKLVGRRYQLSDKARSYIQFENLDLLQVDAVRHAAEPFDMVFTARTMEYVQDQASPEQWGNANLYLTESLRPGGRLYYAEGFEVSRKPEKEFFPSLIQLPFAETDEMPLTIYEKPLLPRSEMRMVDEQAAKRKIKQDKQKFVELLLKDPQTDWNGSSQFLEDLALLDLGKTDNNGRLYITVAPSFGYLFPVIGNKGAGSSVRIIAAKINKMSGLLMLEFEISNHAGMHYFRRFDVTRQQRELKNAQGEKQKILILEAKDATDFPAFEKPPAWDKIVPVQGSSELPKILLTPSAEADGLSLEEKLTAVQNFREAVSFHKTDVEGRIRLFKSGYESYLWQVVPREEKDKKDWQPVLTAVRRKAGRFYLFVTLHKENDDGLKISKESVFSIDPSKTISVLNSGERFFVIQTQPRDEQPAVTVSGFSEVFWTRQKIIAGIQALSEAGIPLNSQAIEEDQSERTMQILEAAVGRNKNGDRINGSALYSASRRLFGSWPEALRASGLNPDKIQKYLRWPLERLVAAMLAIQRDGRIPDSLWDRPVSMNSVYFANYNRNRNQISRSKPSSEVALPWIRPKQKANVSRNSQVRSPRSHSKSPFKAALSRTRPKKEAGVSRNSQTPSPLSLSFQNETLFSGAHSKDGYARSAANLIGEPPQRPDTLIFEDELWQRVEDSISGMAAEDKVIAENLIRTIRDAEEIPDAQGLAQALQEQGLSVDEAGVRRIFGVLAEHLSDWSVEDTEPGAKRSEMRGESREKKMTDQELTGGLKPGKTGFEAAQVFLGGDFGQDFLNKRFKLMEIVVKLFDRMRQRFEMSYFNRQTVYLLIDRVQTRLHGFQSFLDQLQAFAKNPELALQVLKDYLEFAVSGIVGIIGIFRQGRHLTPALDMGGPLSSAASRLEGNNPFFVIIQNIKKTIEVLLNTRNVSPVGQEDNLEIVHAMIQSVSAFTEAVHFSREHLLPLAKDAKLALQILKNDLEFTVAGILGIMTEILRHGRTLAGLRRRVNLFFNNFNLGNSQLMFRSEMRTVDSRKSETRAQKAAYSAGWVTQSIKKIWQLDQKMMNAPAWVKMALFVTSASIFGLYHALQGHLYFSIVPYALLFSMVIHEFSHALAAVKMGDERARESLSLKPWKHFTTAGFVLLPLIGLTYGRVFFDPQKISGKKLRNVALAGPFGSFILGSLFLSAAYAAGALVSTKPSVWQFSLNLMWYLNLPLFSFFQLVPFKYGNITSDGWQAFIEARKEKPASQDTTVSVNTNFRLKSFVQDQIAQLSELDLIQPDIADLLNTVPDSLALSEDDFAVVQSRWAEFNQTLAGLSRWAFLDRIKNALPQKPENILDFMLEHPAARAPLTLLLKYADFDRAPPDVSRSEMRTNQPDKSTERIRSEVRKEKSGSFFEGGKVDVHMGQLRGGDAAGRVQNFDAKEAAVRGHIQNNALFNLDRLFNFARLKTYIEGIRLRIIINFHNLSAFLPISGNQKNLVSVARVNNFEESIIEMFFGQSPPSETVNGIVGVGNGLLNLFPSHGSFVHSLENMVRVVINHGRNIIKKLEIINIKMLFINNLMRQVPGSSSGGRQEEPHWKALKNEPGSSGTVAGSAQRSEVRQGVLSDIPVTGGSAKEQERVRLLLIRLNSKIPSHHVSLLKQIVIVKKWGALGYVSKSSPGTLYINVSAMRDDQTMERIFVHELGHIVNAEMPESKTIWQKHKDHASMMFILNGFFSMVVTVLILFLSVWGDVSKASMGDWLRGAGFQLVLTHINILAHLLYLFSSRPGFVSPMAMVRPDEDFAETYRAFVLTPGLLREKIRTDARLNQKYTDMAMIFGQLPDSTIARSEVRLPPSGSSTAGNLGKKARFIRDLQAVAPGEMVNRFVPRQSADPIAQLYKLRLPYPKSWVQAHGFRKYGALKILSSILDGAIVPMLPEEMKAMGFPEDAIDGRQILGSDGQFREANGIFYQGITSEDDAEIYDGPDFAILSPALVAPDSSYLNHDDHLLYSAPLELISFYVLSTDEKKNFIVEQLRRAHALGFVSKERMELGISKLKVYHEITQMSNEDLIALIGKSKRSEVRMSSSDIENKTRPPKSEVPTDRQRILRQLARMTAESLEEENDGGIQWMAQGEGGGIPLEEKLRGVSAMDTSFPRNVQYLEQVLSAKLSDLEIEQLQVSLKKLEIDLAAADFELSKDYPRLLNEYKGALQAELFAMDLRKDQQKTSVSHTDYLQAVKEALVDLPYLLAMQTLIDAEEDEALERQQQKDATAELFKQTLVNRRYARTLATHPELLRYLWLHFVSGRGLAKLYLAHGVGANKEESWEKIKKNVFREAKEGVEAHTKKRSSNLLLDILEDLRAYYLEHFAEIKETAQKVQAQRTFTEAWNTRIESVKARTAESETQSLVLDYSKAIRATLEAIGDLLSDLAIHYPSMVAFYESLSGSGQIRLIEDTFKAVDQALYSIYNHFEQEAVRKTIPQDWIRIVTKLLSETAVLIDQTELKWKSINSQTSDFLLDAAATITVFWTQKPLIGTQAKPEDLRELNEFLGKWRGIQARIEEDELVLTAVGSLGEITKRLERNLPKSEQTKTPRAEYWRETREALRDLNFQVSARRTIDRAAQLLASKRRSEVRTLPRGSPSGLDPLLRELQLREEPQLFQHYVEASQQAGLSYAEAVEQLSNLAAVYRLDPFSNAIYFMEALIDILEEAAQKSFEAKPVLSGLKELLVRKQERGDFNSAVKHVALGIRAGLTPSQSMALVEHVYQLSNTAGYLFGALYDPLNGLRANNIDGNALFEMLMRGPRNYPDVLTYYSELAELLYLGATHTGYSQGEIVSKIMDIAARPGRLEGQGTSLTVVNEDNSISGETGLISLAAKELGLVPLSSAAGDIAAIVKEPNDYFPEISAKGLVHGILPYRRQRDFSSGLHDLISLMRKEYAEGAWIYDPASQTWFSLGGSTSYQQAGSVRQNFFLYDMARLSQSPVYVHIHPEKGEELIAPSEEGLAYPRLKKKITKFLAAMPSNADFQVFAELLKKSSKPVPISVFIVTSVGITEVKIPNSIQDNQKMAKTFRGFKDKVLLEFDSQAYIRQFGYKEKDIRFVRRLTAQLNASLPQGFTITVHSLNANLTNLLAPRSEVRMIDEKLREPLDAMLENLRYLTGNLRLDNSYGIIGLNDLLRQTDQYLVWAEHALTQVRAELEGGNVSQAMDWLLAAAVHDWVYQAASIIDDVPGRYRITMALKWPDAFSTDYANFAQNWEAFRVELIKAEAHSRQRQPLESVSPAARPQAAMDEPSKGVRMKISYAKGPAGYLTLLPTLMKMALAYGNIPEQSIASYALETILQFAAENALFIGRQAKPSGEFTLSADWTVNPDFVIFRIENESVLPLPDVLLNQGKVFNNQSEIIAVPDDLRNTTAGVRGAGMPNILLHLRQIFPSGAARPSPTVQWKEEEQPDHLWKITFELSLPKPFAARSEVRAFDKEDVIRQLGYWVRPLTLPEESPQTIKEVVANLERLVYENYVEMAALLEELLSDPSPYEPVLSELITTRNEVVSQFGKVNNIPNIVIPRLDFPLIISRLKDLIDFNRQWPVEFIRADFEGFLKEISRLKYVLGKVRPEVEREEDQITVRFQSGSEELEVKEDSVTVGRESDGTLVVEERFSSVDRKLPSELLEKRENHAVFWHKKIRLSAQSIDVLINHDFSGPADRSTQVDEIPVEKIITPDSVKAVRVSRKLLSDQGVLQVVLSPEAWEAWEQRGIRLHRIQFVPSQYPRAKGTLVSNAQDDSRQQEIDQSPQGEETLPSAKSEVRAAKRKVKVPGTQTGDTQIPRSEMRTGEPGTSGRGTQVSHPSFPHVQKGEETLEREDASPSAKSEVAGQPGQSTGVPTDIPDLVRMRIIDVDADKIKNKLAYLIHVWNEADEQNRKWLLSQDIYYDHIRVKFPTIAAKWLMYLLFDDNFIFAVRIAEMIIFKAPAKDRVWVGKNEARGYLNLEPKLLMAHLTNPGLSLKSKAAVVPKLSSGLDFDWQKAFRRKRMAILATFARAIYQGFQSENEQDEYPKKLYFFGTRRARPQMRDWQTNFKRIFKKRFESEFLSNPKGLLGHEEPLPFLDMVILEYARLYWNKLTREKENQGDEKLPPNKSDYAWLEDQLSLLLYHSGDGFFVLQNKLKPYIEALHDKHYIPRAVSESAEFEDSPSVRSEVRTLEPDRSEDEMRTASLKTLQQQIDEIDAQLKMLAEKRKTFEENPKISEKEKTLARMIALLLFGGLLSFLGFVSHWGLSVSGNAIGVFEWIYQMPWIGPALLGAAAWLAASIAAFVADIFINRFYMNWRAAVVYPAAKIVYQRALDQSITPVQLGQWMLKQQTLEDLFKLFKEHELLDSKEPFQHKTFETLAENLWPLVADATLAQFKESTIGQQFGFRGIQVTIGKTTYHILGYIHGISGLPLSVKKIDRLVSHLKQNNFPFFREAGLPNFNKNSYGEELQDTALIRSSFGMIVKILLFLPVFYIDGLLLKIFPFYLHNREKHYTTGPDYITPVPAYLSRGQYMAAMALEGAKTGSSDVVLLTGIGHVSSGAMGWFSFQEEIGQPFSEASRSEVRTAEPEGVGLAEDLELLQGFVPRRERMAIWGKSAMSLQAAGKIYAYPAKASLKELGIQRLIFHFEALEEFRAQAGLLQQAAEEMGTGAFYIRIHNFDPQTGRNEILSLMQELPGYSGIETKSEIARLPASIFRININAAQAGSVVQLQKAAAPALPKQVALKRLPRGKRLRDVDPVLMDSRRAARAARQQTGPRAVDERNVPKLANRLFSEIVEWGAVSQASAKTLVQVADVESVIRNLEKLKQAAESNAERSGLQDESYVQNAMAVMSEVLDYLNGLQNQILQSDHPEGVTIGLITPLAMDKATASQTVEPHAEALKRIAGSINRMVVIGHLPAEFQKVFSAAGISGSKLGMAGNARAVKAPDGQGRLPAIEVGQPEIKGIVSADLLRVALGEQGYEHSQDDFTFYTLATAVTLQYAYSILAAFKLKNGMDPAEISGELLRELDFNAANLFEMSGGKVSIMINAVQTLISEFEVRSEIRKSA